MELAGNLLFDTVPSNPKLALEMAPDYAKYFYAIDVFMRAYSLVPQHMKIIEHYRHSPI